MLLMHVPALLRLIHGTPFKAGEGGDPLTVTVPCLVHLDSCKGYHNGTTMAAKMVKWLHEEGCKRGWAPEKAEVIGRLQLIEQDVPQQPNGICCGVYMLQGIEHFIATWPKVREWHLTYGKIPNLSRSSFRHEDIEVIDPTAVRTQESNLQPIIHLCLQAKRIAIRNMADYLRSKWLVWTGAGDISRGDHNLLQGASQVDTRRLALRFGMEN